MVNIRDMYVPQLSDFGVSRGEIMRDRLVIHGRNGSGKTSLAKCLLEGCSYVTIDTRYLKQSEYIRELVSDHMKKRNVIDMFQCETKRKGLLFDNVDVFYKYDEQTVKYILEVFTSDSDMICILVFHSSFENNRKLSRAIYQSIYLTYSPRLFKRCIARIVKEVCPREEINVEKIRMQVCENRKE